jgi:probable phosphoglycerate mutase
MTSILLIRHATHELVGKKILGRTPGVHLNASGRRQADQLAEKLSTLPIDAVYCSPLERTRESAEPLARRLGLRCSVAEEFDELDMGDWTNRTLGELELSFDWHKWNTHRSETTPPKGESMQQVQERVLGKIAALHEHFHCIAIFTHGDVIRAALARYLGLHLDLLLRFDIDPGSVSVVQMHDNWAVVRVLNWISIERVLS